jgi:predicted glycosyltransferase
MWQPSSTLCAPPCPPASAEFVHVLIDLTNSPHVPLFAPLVRRLRADGHTVTLTARRFAQTVELCQLHGLEAQVIGKHGGKSRLGKALKAVSRVLQLWIYASGVNRREPVTIAVSHGSTDLPIVSRLLRIPHVTMFDYEWAKTMHRLNCRNSTRVVTPDAIPPERLAQYGALPKLRQYPGLKEEYYLADTQFDPDIRRRLNIPDDAVLAVLRPPPELALYHRGKHNLLFDDVLRMLSATEHAHTVVLPRTPDQATILRVLQLPRVTIPFEAVDAQSLIAASDLVVSAGGTMNREAVALGVPVFTVFAGVMGAVDEQLIDQGRLHRLESANDIQVVPRQRGGTVTLRDPQDLLDVLLG